ncbi:hypothetical protein AMTRI_Chr06g174690 [Amborella trichopoda]|uniref:Uncharacterized protein n=1 Tax=Amborella trichopoda TaxID=13333 RepID=W1PAH8_AMBTC|nr:hypothetical protein AMTR_s00005p00256350 [Amborella trichopoda]
MAATSQQFEIKEEWDVEAPFAVVEETKLKNSELAYYQLDDDAQLKFQDDDSDWVAQDEFAQVMHTTSIEVHHEEEKSFALTTSEVDEVKPRTGKKARTTKCDCKDFHKLRNQI